MLARPETATNSALSAATTAGIRPNARERTVAKLIEESESEFAGWLHGTPLESVATITGV